MQYNLIAYDEINLNYLFLTIILVIRRSDRSGSRSPSRSPSPRDDRDKEGSRDKEHSPASPRSRSDSIVKGHDEVKIKKETQIPF